MLKRIAVIGTGSWGTTLAVLMARRGLRVMLWARTAEEAKHLAEARENRDFLPGVTFPDELKVTSVVDEAFAKAEIVFFVVPAQSMRLNVQRVRAYLPANAVLVSAAKGLEIATGKRMSEILAEELPLNMAGQICVLSGPNLAREVAFGRPAATVAAATDERIAVAVQEALITPSFRVYTSSDVVGVELGGALKNIVALGAGMGDALGVGNNAKAAFITRGLAEITRLGVALGANPLTFAGLAGLGDLIATCWSELSRNRLVGQQLAEGRSLAEIQRSMKMVAEGVSTTIVAREMARRYGVQMPITETMYEVLFQGKNPRDAITELMTREPKGEMQGIDRVFSKFLSDMVKQ